MLERADLVFTGRLIEFRTYKVQETIYPYPNAPEKAYVVKSLYTDHVFEVEKVYKGEHNSRTVAITQLGGFNDGSWSAPLGSYFLALGKTYTVIAVRSELNPDRLVTASYGLGVMEHVERDGQTFLQNQGNGDFIEKPNDPRTWLSKSPLTLQEFVSKVEQIKNQQGRDTHD